MAGRALQHAHLEHPRISGVGDTLGVVTSLRPFDDVPLVSTRLG
jgi:hypothetical protein